MVERNTHGTLDASVTFYPSWDHLDRDLLTPFVEAVFCVDRSGSMVRPTHPHTHIPAAILLTLCFQAGARMSNCIKTLSLFLSSLPADAMFNIVGFGTSHVALFPSSLRYEGVSRAAAEKHIAGLRADLGGTDLAKPLRSILSAPPVEGYPRAVFVLTDGEVDDRNETIAIVERTTPACTQLALAGEVFFFVYSFLGC